MLSKVSKPFKQLQSTSSKANNHPLIVQIKIKNKFNKLLTISNYEDSQTIDQQIKWFLTTNSLKSEAFDFIKSIITAKIVEKRAKRAKGIEKLRKQNKENECQILCTTQRIKKQKNVLQECQSSRKITNNESNLIEISLSNISEQTQGTFPVINQEDSFAFSSSFSIPSSIFEHERNKESDKSFETARNQGSNFSTVNQLRPQEKIQMKNPVAFQKKSLFEEDDKPRKSIPKRLPLKIKLDDIETHSHEKTPEKLARKSQEKKKRKNAVINPLSQRKEVYKKDEFIIYDAENLSNMVVEQCNLIREEHKDEQVFDCLPQYLEEDLKTLFAKLTYKNPSEVEKLDSQYVSYQELTKEELVLMGSLFEKIDHKNLSNLDFGQFKLNVAKYCWKQLEELHQKKVKLKNRLNLKYICEEV